MEFIKKYKIYIISILIPLLLGLVIGLVTNNSMDSYEMLEKSKLNPPSYVFPIVWTIIYILMGISAAIIYEKSNDKNKLIIYGIQLIINLTWSIIFFNIQAYLLAFIWIILLLILIIVMIYQFYKIDKLAGILQIPYLIWVTFASYLNFIIYILN